MCLTAPAPAPPMPARKPQPQPMPSPEQFSERLRAWKQAWGYTIPQVCDNLIPGTEIKQRTVEDWLHARSAPPEYAQTLLVDRLKERPKKS